MPARRSRAVESAIERGVDEVQLARAIVRYLRDLSVLQVAPDRAELVDASDEERAELLAEAAELERSRVTQMFERMLRCCDELGKTLQPRLVLDCALIDVATIEPLVPLGDLIDRLGELEARLAGKGGSARRPRGRPRRRCVAAAASPRLRRLPRRRRPRGRARQRRARVPRAASAASAPAAAPSRVAGRRPAPTPSSMAAAPSPREAGRRPDGRCRPGDARRSSDAADRARSRRRRRSRRAPARTTIAAPAPTMARADDARRRAARVERRARRARGAAQDLAARRLRARARAEVDRRIELELGFPADVHAMGEMAAERDNARRAARRSLARARPRAQA